MPTGLRDNHQGRRCCRCSSSAAHNKFDTKLKYLKDKHTQVNTETHSLASCQPPPSASYAPGHWQCKQLARKRNLLTAKSRSLYTLTPFRNTYLLEYLVLAPQINSSQNCDTYAQNTAIQCGTFQFIPQTPHASHFLRYSIANIAKK